MKKEMILTFVIALSFGLIFDASAFSEAYEGPIGDSSSMIKIQKVSQQKLNEALQNRWYSYQKNP